MGFSETRRQPRQDEDHREHVAGDIIDGGTALATITREEIDMQIATAKKFPRNIRTVKDKIHALATLDEDTAAACFYSVPRAGKIIQGPSVRLAEIAISQYQNLRAGTRIVEIGETHVVAQGVIHDVENNVVVSMETRRRITDKNGKRYNDDGIITTCNAAAAIALRNAAFKVIPGALIIPVYEQCKALAAGEGKPLAFRRGRIVDRLKNAFGVQVEQILGAIEKVEPGRKLQSIEDIVDRDIEYLTGLGTAIKDGDISIEEAFPMPAKEPEAPAEGKAAFGFAKKKKEAKAAKEPAPEPATEPAGEPEEQAIDPDPEPAKPQRTRPAKPEPKAEPDGPGELTAEDLMIEWGMRFEVQPSVAKASLAKWFRSTSELDPDEADQEALQKALAAIRGMKPQTAKLYAPRAPVAE